MIELGKYKHYKGNEYEVIGIGKHSETMEELVFYRDVHDTDKLWARPISMWDEVVKVGDKEVKRFTKI